MALDAAAAGLAAGSASALLGQPLDFTVQVRLQAGETLTQECVSAEVTVGERRVPPALVRALLVPSGRDGARIQVTTDLAVDEPVVGVVVNAGCASARLTRRFVVLADPPMANALPTATVAMPAMLQAPGAAPSNSEAPAPPALSEAGAAAASEGAARASVPPAARSTPRAVRRQAQSQAQAQAQAQRPTRAERRAAAPRRDTPAAEAAARLRLEPVAAPPTEAAVGVEAALQAVADASSAARAAAAAASATALRIATLERTVAELRLEANAGRDSAGALRARLARAEQASRWTLPLLALVLLVTALAAWLAWRLSSAERARQRAWQPQAAGAGHAQPGPAVQNSEFTPSKLPTAPIPFVNSEVRLPPAPAARARPAWPAPVSVAPDTEPPRTTGQPVFRPEPESAMLRTEPMPPRGVLEETAPRDVSIEELIDLEQQAEFFVVLGQDAAAVELLVEHLRHTGGGSPLPYLKLLEIYRRRGSRAEYERLRERFNLRFNAYAPGWESDLQAGRTLDSYAGVIPRLQQVWPRPLDAMAELEALLFRKSRGDLFELPAYREVLFLYSLARDLLDREATDGGQIDVLLPLADGGEFSSTSPAPYLALDHESRHGSLDGKSTATLDFDLSVDAGRATSIFGPLDGPEPRLNRQ